MPEPLEPRQMLAWGPYPLLIGQDVAAARYPKINGAGTAIALIDTGVDFKHPSLAGKIWTNPGEIAGNGRDDDGNGFIDDVHGWDFYRGDNHPEDENGHGTALASIMVAGHFTFGGDTYRGVAPGAKVIPLKVADPTGRIADIGFARRIEQALRWVERNHKRYKIVAVNMSLRVRETADYDATFRDEIRRLAKRGVFMVATSRRPPNEPGRSVYPAGDRNVFTTGIINPDGMISSYRRWHRKDDLLAPGNGVPVALLNRGQMGASAEASSYAAPFVTATAALIRQIRPGFTNAQVSAILKESSTRVVDPATGQKYMRLQVDRALSLAKQRARQLARADQRGQAKALATTASPEAKSLFSARRIPMLPAADAQQPLQAKLTFSY